MDEQLLRSFMISTSSVFGQMAGIEIGSWETGPPCVIGTILHGYSTLTRFTGEINGSFLLDMEKTVAEELTKTVFSLETDQVNETMLTAALLEINNMIGGDAITDLNNALRMKLRLVPPVVITDRDVILTTPGSLAVQAKGEIPHGIVSFTVSWHGCKEL